MAHTIARLAREPEVVARMRDWNVSHPPAQDWATVAGRAVREYERAIGERVGG
jgi:hypothetical protein